MPIDLSPWSEAITAFLSKCAFSADIPIDVCINEDLCYRAECYTNGLVLMALALILLILKWRGIRI